MGGCRSQLRHHALQLLEPHQLLPRRPIDVKLSLPLRAPQQHVLRLPNVEVVGQELDEDSVRLIMEMGVGSQSALCSEDLVDRG